MRQVDFQGIGAELKALLIDARRQLSGVDLRGVADQWKATGRSVDALARSPQIQQTFSNLNDTLLKLQGTLAKLDTQVDGNGAELKATLAEARTTIESFNATALTARRFISSQQDFGSDADRAFVKLSEAADAVQRLADFLERNPNSLISGKKQSP